MKKALIFLLITVLFVLGLSSCLGEAMLEVCFIVDGEVYDTVRVGEKELITIPKDPTKEGYTFDGWYWDKDVWEDPFTANSLLDTPLSSKMTVRVYAKWSSLGHTHTPALAVRENVIEPTCKTEGSYDSVVYCDSCEEELSRTQNRLPVSLTSHNMVSGVCSDCHLTNSSEGLLFYLNADEKGYTLVGKGSFSGEHLFVGLYRGLPVTHIAQGVFADTTSLRTVLIGKGVTSIGSEAFYGCTRLVSVTLSDTITSIEEEAFSQCTGLVSVTLPDSVTHIGKSAFYNCFAIERLVIGKGVKDIERNAFKGCRGLTEITFNATKMNDLGTNNAVFSSAGQNGTGITVTIGSNVTRIPAYLFSPIISETYSPKIKTLAFEDGSVCQSIGESAFEHCFALTSLEIPPSIKSIEDAAFGDCYAITDIRFNATEMADLKAYNYVFKHAGKKAAGITVTVGSNVTKIPDFLFNPYSTDYPKITSVAFEDDSVCQSIGTRAFYACGELESIFIPASVKSIGSKAFENCAALASIQLENPNGWSAVDIYDTKTEFLGTELSSTTVAARYLCAIYYDCDWYRK
ncbi:MAG: leucine-rich repeat protein [Clostridia bacterium]|nr:leucine-rich repeat protein [Clostridia bacterium]